MAHATARAFEPQTALRRTRWFTGSFIWLSVEQTNGQLGQHQEKRANSLRSRCLYRWLHVERRATCHIVSVQDWRTDLRVLDVTRLFCVCYVRVFCFELI